FPLLRRPDVDFDLLHYRGLPHVVPETPGTQRGLGADFFGACLGRHRVADPSHFAREATVLLRRSRTLRRRGAQPLQGLSKEQLERRVGVEPRAATLGAALRLSWLVAQIYQRGDQIRF